MLFSYSYVSYVMEKRGKNIHLHISCKSRIFTSVTLFHYYVPLDQIDALQLVYHAPRQSCSLTQPPTGETFVGDISVSQTCYVSFYYKGIFPLYGLPKKARNAP